MLHCQIQLLKKTLTLSMILSHDALEFKFWFEINKEKYYTNGLEYVKKPIMKELL
jgi:hypothetical protein